MAEYSFASVATLSRLVEETRRIQMVFLQETLVLEWDLCLLGFQIIWATISLKNCQSIHRYLFTGWALQCIPHRMEEDVDEVVVEWVVVAVE